MANVLAGRGLNYGTVVQYECDAGYERTGLPVLLCQSNGTWSSAVPTCSRKRCFDFPEIENGFIVDKSIPYFYGDTARVECHRGYARLVVICFHSVFKTLLTAFHPSILLKMRTLKLIHMPSLFPCLKLMKVLMQ